MTGAQSAEIARSAQPQLAQKPVPEHIGRDHDRVCNFGGLDDIDFDSWPQQHGGLEFG